MEGPEQGTGAEGLNVQGRSRVGSDESLSSGSGILSPLFPGPHPLLRASSVSHSVAPLTPGGSGHVFMPHMEGPTARAGPWLSLKSR